MNIESTLSPAPEAVEFNKKIGMKTYRKAMLGDHTTYAPDPLNYPMVADQAISEGLAKVQALANDQTRTLVQKHDVARYVTEVACEKLENARKGMERDASKLDDEGQAAILKRLDLDKINPKTLDMVNAWIMRTAKLPDGHATIRKRVESDVDVATAVFYSKGYLLDLPDDFHGRMIDLAHKSHAPEAIAKFERSSQLRKWAGNYTQVQKSMRASWYNKALAAQASTRVDV
jgi:hypothetical protein